MSEKKLYKSSSGIEIEIVLGSGKLGTEKQQELYDAKTYWIHEDIRNIKESFIKLGFHLREIQRYEIYKVYGYEDFYEFCDNNFHISRSTVSRYINLYSRFCMVSKDFTKTMFIDKRYESYSYSQLCEMLPLSDVEMSKIKPDMTIKEIREYKADLKNEKLQNLVQYIDKVSKESIVVESEPKLVVCDVAQSENDLEEKSYDEMIKDAIEKRSEECPVKTFNGSCTSCPYRDNGGCYFPAQWQYEEICDVAQEESEQEEMEDIELLPKQSFLTPKDSMLILKKMDSIQYHIANDNYTQALTALELLRHCLVGIMGD